MTFVSCRLEQRYNSTDLNLAIELAQRIALAIDNARLYQEAQQANRLKDEFLAIVSHELRTPLNSILGWARMLKRGQVNEAIFKRAIETIERNANAQNRLINDLLDISRITQNRLNLELEPLDLIPIIDAVIEALHPIAEAKSIRIETQLDPSSKQVMGDAERLQQVIWNLLTNAIKFTPSQGRIGVELRYQPSDRTSSVAYAQLLVADTGQGISAEFLPHVFERFRQEETSTTQTQSGLGLGLAIVRHIVEMHHGSVDVTSEGIGQGSIFTVRLPLLQ